MATCVRKATMFLMCIAVVPMSTYCRRRSSSSVLGGCRDGMFDDRQRGAEPDRPNCRPCSKCLPGYGASRLCTRYNDTECAPCSSGHYSSTTSRQDSCIPCTVCGTREPEIEACTTEKDAKCRKHCWIGSFYSHSGDECLPCSSCHIDNANNTRVQQCVEDDMPVDMQCWPQQPNRDEDVPSAMPDNMSKGESSNYDNMLPTTTYYHVRPVASSPRSGQVSNEDGLDNTEDTAQTYTWVLLTLLIVVFLCVVLSIGILACLCRVMKNDILRSSYQRTTTDYQRISYKPPDLLVRHMPTYV